MRQKRKPKKVIIELTDEQLKSLQKLFDYSKENPSTGFVIGQVYGEPYKNGFFEFLTPSELMEKLEKLKNGFFVRIG